ncbi:MAG: thioredoxin family protein [Mariniblastus sp.]|nr:thioredoxin family protein [Mariniblastus sp.]
MELAAVLTMTLSALLVNDGSTSDYKSAYEKAQAGNKPLLILVTAEWCPPCQKMKKKTIPKLMAKEAFKHFHFATVDLDKESALARKLIGSRGVPQLIMYERKDDKWIRRYLRGAQTPSKVEAFIARAELVRTADAQDAIKK